MTNDLLLFASLVAGVFVAFVIPYQIKINNNSILITSKKDWFGQIDTRYIIDANLAWILTWLYNFIMQYSALPEPQSYILAFTSGFVGFDIIKWSHKVFDKYK